MTIGAYEAPNCTCTPVGTLPCGITIASTHPLAAKQFVTFADLAAFPAGESHVYDSFNDSILTTFKKRGLVTNISHISKATEALAHIMLKQGYYFSVVISQLTKPKLTTVLRPIDPAEDPRIPICFVTRNDRAGARHRVVQNFLLHAMGLVSN